MAAAARRAFSAVLSQPSDDHSFVRSCQPCVASELGFDSPSVHKPHRPDHRLHGWESNMASDQSAQSASKVTVYGRTGSPQCYAIRDFLYRNDVPFEWVELHTDEEARAIGLEG